MAVDPGARHIGIAFRIAGIYTTCKGSTPSDLYSFFTKQLDLVIVERFDTNWIDRYGLDTTKMWGGIEALCIYKSIPIIIHPPQYRRAFLEPARTLIREILKRDGRKGIDPHEVDALAHLLSWERLQEHA